MNISAKELLAAILMTLSVTAGISNARATALGSDVAHWISYAFSEGTATVTTKVPPGLRVFNPRLPELTYKRAQRLLLDAQYDYGSGDLSFTSEFEIQFNFVKLAEPLDLASFNAEALDRALTSAFGHPIKGPNSPQPTEQLIHGIEWIHYDNTTDVTYGQTRETYATILDSTTILVITGWYGPNLRKDPKRFDSRREILRTVCDNTSITHP